MSNGNGNTQQYDGKPAEAPEELASMTPIDAAPTADNGQNGGGGEHLTDDGVSQAGGAGGDGGGRSDQPPARVVPPFDRTGSVVRLAPSEEVLVVEQVLWDVIRDRTRRISFNSYNTCIDNVLCNSLFSHQAPAGQPPNCVTPEPPQRARYNVYGTDSYTLLKAVTECFLMQECGRLDEVFHDVIYGKQNVKGYCSGGSDDEKGFCAALKEEYLDHLCDEKEPGVLPYLRLIRGALSEIPLKPDLALGTGCYGILKSRFCGPCFIELIWSYWHEEGMLCQTMNAISLRFQNIRSDALVNPLAHLAIDPLRPLANLIWGYIQDEQHRLSVVRRAIEYEYHYGMNLLGKAVPKLQFVERRSRFLEAFHSLLQLCVPFFKQVDDLTVNADGFPLLNALKDIHILLAEGMNNQFGDLPWTARVEMLMMQWLLARPEFREFLGGRVMVPYAEHWMDRVDTMKSLQGWSDTSVTVFHELAEKGEQILLSIRYTNWSQIFDPRVASSWAQFWRPEIQNYMYNYRTATGVDLTAEVADAQQTAQRYLPPAQHLSRRLAEQRGNALPPPASKAGLIPAASANRIRAPIASAGPTPLVASDPAPARIRQ
jgi:hypothetical protein